MIVITVAHLVLLVYTLYVIIVIMGVPLIIIGQFRHWNWVHNGWIRGGHLCMIALVALEVLCGMRCPLMTLEQSLREQHATIGAQS